VGMHLRITDYYLHKMHAAQKLTIHSANESGTLFECLQPLESAALSRVCLNCACYMEKHISRTWTNHSPGLSAGPWSLWRTSALPSGAFPAPVSDLNELVGLVLLQAEDIALARILLKLVGTGRGEMNCLL